MVSEAASLFRVYEHQSAASIVSGLEPRERFIDEPSDRLRAGGFGVGLRCDPGIETSHALQAASLLAVNLGSYYDCKATPAVLQALLAVASAA